MKAILIDPHQREVTEVEYDGVYTSIYKLIDAETFDLARLPDGDGIFVDDEGLLKQPIDFFRLQGMTEPLTGKGLVLGSDAEGESIPPKITIEQIKKRIMWGVRIGSAILWGCA